MLQTVRPNCFLIADISGYTGYLADAELAHADDILADLIAIVVATLEPRFRLAKIEGDAAFTFAPGERVDGSMLLDTIESCYFAFRRRRRNVRQATSCNCNACARIPDLNLKFVAHHGEAIQRRLAGSMELVGSDVITVHRLLKNNVVPQFGLSAYALLTQKCVDASDVDPAGLDMWPHSEVLEGVGNVQGWVHDLERRWSEEEERARVYVSPGEAILDVSARTKVPAQTAWEFLTTPGQRTNWQPWVTEVVVESGEGGRRGLGSSNHCMHGPGAVVEEILDWRPYCYVTDRTIIETPEGPVKMLHTVEITVDEDGTVVHFRYAAPQTEREVEMLEMSAPGYEQMLRFQLPVLLAELDRAFANATSETTEGAH